MLVFQVASGFLDYLTHFMGQRARKTKKKISIKIGVAVKYAVNWVGTFKS